MMITMMKAAKMSAGDTFQPPEPPETRRGLALSCTSVVSTVKPNSPAKRCATSAVSSSIAGPY